MAQIGTVKLETQNSGVVDVPVFETGDSASGVYEFVRVETASGAGFIPVTDPADATYPYLRVQSQNNGIVAVTDTAGSDIPDNDLYPSQPYEQTTYSPYENVQPDPDVTNPVLSAADVTDESATYVADPFLYVPDGDDGFSEWHMFFETQRSDYAVIGHATSPDTGVSWNYDQTVIDAGTHLSYPRVFRIGGDYYIWANRSANDYSPLYKADTFPTSWTEVAQYLNDVSHPFKDHSVFLHNDRWWFIVGTDDGSTNGGIRVYYSDQNDGIENINWTPHPENPVVSGRTSAARSAGRAIMESDGTMLIWLQDCVNQYGDMVRAYEVTTLTTTSYTDSELAESPILDGTGSGWDSDRMHHYDPWWVDSEDKWRAAVDGDDGGGSSWEIGIYQAGPDTGGGSTVLVSDDFESGSLSADWTGDSEFATVQDTTVITGSFSLQLDAGPSELLQSWSPTEVGYFESQFRTTDANEATYWRLYNGGTRNVNVRVDGGEIQYYTGSSYVTVATGLQSGTDYTLRLENFDYSANTFDIVLDGTTEGTGDFESGVSGHDEMSFRMGNATHTTYFDDVNVESK